MPWSQVFVGQDSPGGFQRGVGDTRGGRKIRFQGKPMAVMQHKFQAGQTQNIGDFMGVGNQGRCPKGQEHRRQIGRGHHSTFNMKVPVDKTRGDKAVTTIDDFPAFIRPEADDTILANGHIGLLDFTGKDIDDFTSFKDQVGGDFAPGGADESVKFGDGHGVIESLSH